jgi:hypothetical protein
MDSTVWGLILGMVWLVLLDNRVVHVCISINNQYIREQMERIEYMVSNLPPTLSNVVMLVMHHLIFYLSSDLFIIVY